MAGNIDPGDSESTTPGKPSKPRLKTFSCPNCGASVTIRNAGSSLSVACESCHATIDLMDPNYRIISTFNKAIQEYKPRFELGTRGKLFGKEWEISGFMLRADEASGYSWEEYLLFNPYYGYRWLLQDRGHWSFVTPTKRTPEKNGPMEKGVRYGGKTYKLFSTGTATVRWVIGEFYWKVKVNQAVGMTDYICPPQMLSRENDQNEINWSVGEYVEPKLIEKAFKSEYAMPARIGIGAIQPSPAAANFMGMLPFWGLFLIATIAIQCWVVAKSSNALIFDQPFIFVTNEKKNDITSAVFKVPKDHANLELSFASDVDNSWLYLAGELVDDKTGASYPFERSIEYYHGYDGGESWSEGHTSESLTFPDVPGGQYYLNLDTESGGFPVAQTQRQFRVTAMRDIPGWWNFWCCALALSILPIWYWMMRHNTEVARWSDSYYTPYTSSSD